MYAVRRVLALAKDKARKEAGKAPTHLYKPDLNHVPDAVAAKLAREAAGIIASYVQAGAVHPKPASRASVKAPRPATAARSVKA